MRASRQHKTPHRRRAAQALALASLAVALVGCKYREDVTASATTDYRQRHPIVVKESPRTLELFVGTRRGGLSPEQRAEVLAFGRAWHRQATGGVIIDLPAGTPNEKAAAESMLEARSILAAAGVPSNATVTRPYRPTDPGAMATLRISYPTMTPQVGPCGLWPNDIGVSYQSKDMSNVNYWNHGCASQRNLAAMVSNPQDLVQPRPETPIYAARRTIVLDKFRKGETTATVDPNAQKGKISDVGQ